jgi:hypothetical protein
LSGLLSVLENLVYTYKFRIFYSIDDICHSSDINNAAVAWLARTFGADVLDIRDRKPVPLHQQ